MLYQSTTPGETLSHLFCSPVTPFLRNINQEQCHPIINRHGYVILDLLKACVTDNRLPKLLPYALLPANIVLALDISLDKESGRLI